VVNLSRLLARDYVDCDFDAALPAIVNNRFDFILIGKPVTQKTRTRNSGTRILDFEFRPEPEP